MRRGIAGTVERLIQPIFKDGYELFDIEYKKEGPNYYLRIYVDKEGGINIDDCEYISREVDKILEEEDPIADAYILQVSSPGIDRPLRNEDDYHKYTGEIVDIRLYKGYDNRKKFQGELLGLEDEIVTIREETGDIFKFKLDEISMTRLAVIF